MADLPVTGGPEAPVERTLVADAEELVRSARTRVLAAARTAIAARGRFDLALAGGSTPRALYHALAREPLDFGSWHVWFGDERCVAPDHPDSNHGMVAATGLLARLPPAHVHRMRGEAAAPSAEAERYARELLASLGTPPRLDLVLLGLGRDGHTASLFPGTPAIDASAWVTVGRAPGPPVERITLTFATLREARAVLFLVAGADKAWALRQVLGSSRAQPLPAALVRPQSGQLRWLIERSALPPDAAGG